MADSNNYGGPSNTVTVGKATISPPMGLCKGGGPDPCRDNCAREGSREGGREGSADSGGTQKK